MPQLTAGTTLVARYEVKALETFPAHTVEKWLAEDKIFGREVDLYVLDKEVREGALKRARQSAQLNVERIARVIDVIDKGPQQRFIVTERPVGVATAAAITNSPFTVKQAKAVIGSIATSLVKAYDSQGLRHGAITADSIFFRNDTVTLTGLVPRNFLGFNEDESGDLLALKDTKGLAALTYFMLTGLMHNYSAQESTPLPRLSDFLEDADDNIDAYTTDILNSDQGDVTTPQQFLEALGEWSADDMPNVPEVAEVEVPEANEPEKSAGPLQRTSTRTSSITAVPLPSSQPPAAAAGISVGAIGGAAATLAASGELGRQAAADASTGLSTTTGAAAASAGSSGLGSAASAASSAGNAVNRVGSGVAKTGLTASASSPSLTGSHSPVPAVSAPPEVPASLTSPDAQDALNAGGLPRFLPSTTDISLDSPKAPPAKAAPRNDDSAVWGASSGNASAAKRGFNPTPFIMVLFLAIVIVGLVWSVKGLTAPTVPAIVAPTGRPTATEEAGSEGGKGSDSKPKDTEEVVLPEVKSAVQLDPDGDENEHPELQDKLVDGDTTTPWYSRTYKTANFGGINKSGIGAKVTLEKEATVSSVLISSANKGGKIEIRDGSAKHPKDGKLLGKGTFDGETVIKLDKATKVKSLSVWVTEMPTDQNGAFRVYIYEIALT